MEKKKNTGLKIILTVLALVVAAAGAAGGWYWTSYQKASTAADAGLFAAAEPFLKLEKVTNLHDAEFGDYVRSGLLKDSGDYTAARDAFDALGEYRSSSAMAQDCRYQIAANLFDGKDYEQAKADFEALGDYSDAATRVLDCDYAMAEILMEDESFGDAVSAFEALGDYKDAAEMVLECRLLSAEKHLEKPDYVAAFEAMKRLRDDYPKAADRLVELLPDMYKAAGEAMEAENYSLAVSLYTRLSAEYDYEDSGDLLHYAKLCTGHYADEDYEFVLERADTEFASELLVSTQDIAVTFLSGTWKSSDGSTFFTMDGETYEITYNLPYVELKDSYYTIENGVVFLYQEGDDPEEPYLNRTDLFGIGVQDKDHIVVYCYANGTIYLLARA